MSNTEPPSQRRDFFISYNSADRDWAEWIASELEAEGFTTFVQAWDILPGSNFVMEMQRAATSSDRTIAVLSPTYLGSKFTAAEWAVAFAQDPDGKKGKLLPVRVKECQPEGLLAQIVRCHLDGRNAADARRELLAAVKPERPAPGSIPFPTNTDAGRPKGRVPFPGAPVDAAELAIQGVEDQFRYHGLVPIGEEEIGAYGRVFHWLVDAEWKSRPLIPRIVDRIQMGNRFPLLITGQPGSGKSTLLAVLYRTLLVRFREDAARAPLPFLLDLSWFHTAESSGRVASLEGYLAHLRPWLERGHRAILLVDGVDEFGVEAEPLRKRLAEFIDQASGVRKVVAVAKPLDGDPEQPEIARGPAARLVLSGVALGAAQQDAPKLIADYLALRKRDGQAQKQLAAVLKDLHLRYLDLQTLALLESKLAKKPGATPSGLTQPYHQVKSLADFYYERCAEQLPDKADRQACGQLAFQLTVGGTPAASGECQRHWRLMHSHESVRHFLVALHIVNQLKRSDLTEEDVEGLNYAYPRAVSHFCRELVSFNLQKEEQFVQAMESLFPRAAEAPKLRSHMAYLLGRVRFTPAGRVRRILRGWLNEANQRADRPEASGHDLLFARSIYISLAYLDDRNAQAEYLQKLIVNRRWNRLNCGFHLEYYGDIQWNPREPDNDMAHEDNGKEWGNTREALLDQLDGEANRVFEIDLFTLGSLAQRRLGTHYLSGAQRQQIVGRVEAALRPDAPQTISSVRDYLTALLWQLREGAFSPMSVVDLVGRIKTTPRRGWRRCRLPVGETVSSHSYSAVLLAEILLPERGSYNKREVVRMLMAHDLAECVTGDTLPSEDGDVARGREEQAYRFLASCATHEGVEQLAEWQRLHEVFVAQATPEARIARDFDRLENLIQLMVFKPFFSDEQEYADFLDDLRSKITTVEVQALRDAALRYFGKEQRAGGEWLKHLEEWELNSRQAGEV